MRLNSFTIKIIHIVLITAILAFAINIYVVERTEYQKTAERLNKLRVVFAVQQSSEDLTKFATNYIHTGDKTSEDNFNKIISIRNGSSPRPRNINSSYWFLSEEMKASTHPLTTKKSLVSIANECNFTKKEKGLFFSALALSERLAEIEIAMFELKDNNHSAKAYNILYSPKYINIKVSIMQKIDTFSIVVNNHIDSEIEKLNQEKLNSLIRLLASVFLLSIFPLITKIRF